MTTHVDDTLRRAVQRLGPERAQQALRAFESGMPEGWQACPLACAYGPRGELAQLIREQFDSLRMGSFHIASRALGLSKDEVFVIVRAFDGHQPMRNLLRDLLTAEASKAHGRVAVAERSDAKNEFRSSVVAEMAAQGAKK